MRPDPLDAASRTSKLHRRRLTPMASRPISDLDVDRLWQRVRDRNPSPRQLDALTDALAVMIPVLVARKLGVVLDEDAWDWTPEKAEEQMVNEVNARIEAVSALFPSADWEEDVREILRANGFRGPQTIVGDGVEVVVDCGSDDDWPHGNC